MPSKNVKNYFLGIVTRKNIPFYRRKNYIRVTSKPKKLWGYAGILLKHDNAPDQLCSKTPILFGIDDSDVSHLDDGDIILVDSLGNIRVLWAVSASDNCLMLTESCNCRCLTCPQPPKRHNSSYFSVATHTLRLLDPVHVRQICLTGGEPTLHEEEFLAILQICKRKFPCAHLEILTNGKRLSDPEFVKKVVEVGFKDMLFCVSLHADVDDIHDRIVGVQGSFAKTVAGIHNLARLGLPVEIRFVVSKLNFHRMVSFANFVSRNFPFVVHVAFMGLEVIGLAVDNYDSIWIDPTSYQMELSMAVKELNRRAINVSIYNIPLCLLRKDAWPFARQSISVWKNALLPVCRTCKLAEACCGIFTTSGSLQSSNIRPVAEGEG